MTPIGSIHTLYVGYDIFTCFDSPIEKYEKHEKYTLNVWSLAYSGTECLEGLGNDVAPFLYTIEGEDYWK